MRKIIFTLIVLLAFFFNTPKTASGQDIFTYKDNIPGFSCGIPGDKTGKDRCCNIPNNIKCQNLILTVIGGISAVTPFGPYVNKGINDFEAGCVKMQEFARQQNDTACILGDPSSSNFSDPSCKCIDPNSNPNVNVAIAEMCYKYLGSSSKVNELNSCLGCSSQNGMWTGLGCLPLDINRLIGSFVLSTGIGIGGMFALLCIIYSAFMMQSSEGNPEKLKKAQEMITSCILGLMLIIFSVLIMKIIGVNILRIPGFGP